MSEQVAKYQELADDFLRRANGASSEVAAAGFAQAAATFVLAAETRLAALYPRARK